MGIFPFKDGQQQFRLVGHIDVSIVVAIPIASFVSIDILAARDVDLHHLHAFNLHDTGREIGARQEKLGVIDTIDDVGSQLLNLFWIDTNDGSVILNADKNLSTTMVQERADRFVE